MKFTIKCSRHCGPADIGKRLRRRHFGVRAVRLGAVLVLGLMAWNVGFMPSIVYAESASGSHDSGDHERERERERDSDEENEKSLEVHEAQGIKFGTVAGSSDGSGSVILSPTGALNTTGFGVLIAGNARAGKYKVKGPPGATVLITLPSSAQVSSGSASTTLSSFTSSPSMVGTLNSRGKLTILVGATMALPAGLPGGKYTGTYAIFVDLQ